MIRNPGIWIAFLLALGAGYLYLTGPRNANPTKLENLEPIKALELWTAQSDWSCEAEWQQLAGNAYTFCQPAKTNALLPEGGLELVPYDHVTVVILTETGQSQELLFSVTESGEGRTVDPIFVLKPDPTPCECDDDG